MNTKHFYIAGCVALFSLTSPKCASSTQGITNNNIMINLPSGHNNELISNHLQLSDIIYLETIDSSLIRSIRRLIIHKDTIIILNDREEVMFFDMKGKFLNKIRNRGGGPGEYNHIIDIAIDYDRDDIILYTDNFSLFIYSLDGTFISKTDNIDTNNLYEKIIYNNNLLFYNPLNTNDKSIIRSFDLNNSKYVDNKFIGKTADFILRQRGVPIVKSKSIWYVVPLGNSLLNLEGTVTYQINCDKFGITDAILDKQYTEPGKLVKEINEKQICYGFSSIRETNKFIYFKSNVHDFIRLDKTNNEVKWCQYARDLKNGISEMSYFPHDADDQQIMFIVDFNGLENSDILKRHTEKMDDTHNEELNPVLIFYKEKQ